MLLKIENCGWSVDEALLEHRLIKEIMYVFKYTGRGTYPITDLETASCSTIKQTTLTLDSDYVAMPELFSTPVLGIL